MAADSASGRTLVVMRHARAEPVAASDFERRLADSGHDDAAEAGRWLAGSGVQPDLALVSAATRTDQTWHDVADAAGWTDTDLRSSRALYETDAEGALDLVAGLPADVSTLMLVGHNPVMGYLAQLLDDGDGDPEAAARLATGFPTASAAVFDVEVAWAELGAMSARLRAFHVGRG